MADSGATSYELRGKRFSVIASPWKFDLPPPVESSLISRLGSLLDSRIEILHGLIRFILMFNLLRRLFELLRIFCDSNAFHNLFDSPCTYNGM